MNGRFLFSFLFSFFLSLASAEDRKPNFVVIFTDDQGYQDLGCYGSPDIMTPRLDRMAKEGVRFTHFYAQTVCGPSRAALMTGCYPLRVPMDRIIDGDDIGDLIHGVEGAMSEKKAFFYYQQTSLQAVRSGRWKLHLPGARHWPQYSKAGDVPEFESVLLFDLESDVGESTDVAAAHPEVVESLLALAEKARIDIGDHDRIGEGARFFDPEKRRPDVKR